LQLIVLIFYFSGQACFSGLAFAHYQQFGFVKIICAFSFQLFKI
jgi:hypothetical protein